MNVTPYAEVNGLLDELLAGMRAALGDGLAGLYLYGSLVSGDFDPLRSDIDLLAATRADVNAAQLAWLGRMHDALAAAHPTWDGRIEVAYFALAALAACQTDTNAIAVISPGEPLHIKDAGPDWLVNWYVVQEKGVTLYGPPHTAIIPHISQAAFVDVIAGHTRMWADWVRAEWTPEPGRCGAQAYVVFTMCRALYTLRTGEQASKPQAARWVKAAYPQWAALIDRAGAWRLAADDAHVSAGEAAQVAALVQFVNDELDRRPGEYGA